MNRSIWSLLKRVQRPDDPSSDQAILRRFVQNRDEAAFELLVWRHGGFVLSVCQRMMRDEHAAEDAFQATFLILARKAGTINGSLAGWLFKVARRVCLRARMRTPVAVAMGDNRIASELPTPLLSAELSAILDEEIAGLPEKLRQPVIVCYLQSRTTDDAAKLLGIPRGTVLSRLFHARKRLSARLSRRGIVVPATLLTGTMALPTLSAQVCRSIAMSAMGFLNRTFELSPSTQLAHEVLAMTAQKTVRGIAVAMILAACIGTGVTVVIAQNAGQVPDQVATNAIAANTQPELPKPAAKPSVDEAKELYVTRIALLMNSEKHLIAQIKVKEMERPHFATLSAEEVDPKALQEKLERMDGDILKEEDSLASIEQSLKRFQRDMDEVKAGRISDTHPIIPDVLVRVNQSQEVREANDRYSNLVQQMNALKQRDMPDTELLSKAEKKLKVAEKELQNAREVIKPREEKASRESYILRTEYIIKKQQESIVTIRESLTMYRKSRAVLVMRIQSSKKNVGALHLIDDEIQVLREVRKQVLKERLMMEAGLGERGK